MATLRCALFALFCLTACAQDSLLDWMNGIAQKQLDARDAAIKKITSVPLAEQRKAFTRAKILELLGGLPDYRGPLEARVTGRIEQPGYTIENVIFQSLPNIWITANLYRPSAAGRYPAVLMPMGHWEEGKIAGQRIAANLALKGFVVLSYDPSGQGERQQAYDPRIRTSLIGGSTEQHILNGAQTILTGESFARFRIWDAKRALDYLASRPEVDSDKIGCTGCSGGGTLTTYISALDPRIKVAAPSCYINTFRLLFSGPTGDSEQSLPFFLSSGLDVPDYIELFAPKPYLISNTIADFFPLEGAREAYQEARDWYKVYGAEDKIRWSVGHGGHGTPLEIREGIYDWMIRWLKDGQGDPKEQAIEMLPDFRLWATKTGQVEGRDVYQAVHDDFEKNRSPGTQEQLLAELHRWAGAAPKTAPVRVVSESAQAQTRVRQIAIEVEPGLEIRGTLYVPRAEGRRPALLVSGMPENLAGQAAARDIVVLSLIPRGAAEKQSRLYSGDWLANTRALLIGRDLAGMRASDLMAGISYLSSLPETDPARIQAAAGGPSGTWLLIAAALDPRITAVWIDRTPPSLRQALEMPMHRGLHDAALPGFALHWDLNDVVQAIAPRRVFWSDPEDWLGRVTPAMTGFHYRSFEEGDERLLAEFLRTR